MNYKQIANILSIVSTLFLALSQEEEKKENLQNNDIKGLENGSN